MNRDEKVACVEQIKARVLASEGVLLFRQKGLEASDTFKLRCGAREAGVSFKIAKNTLTKLAFRGTPYECLESDLNGPLGFVCGSSFIEVAKWAAEASKDYEGFQVVSGVMDGQHLSSEMLSKIAKLPSMNVLRGCLVGLLQAPASRLVGITRAAGEKVARVLGLYGSSS